MNKKSIVAPGNKLLAGLLTSLAGLTAGHSQQLAFPGALGYGEYATGGRGGTVYHVTNLSDSGAGSFRDAVSQANRIIVFDVGGYIALGSAVSCSDNLTIAGQTAPGGGIGVMNNEVSFSGKNNIICRHMRFRQGGSSTGSSAINLGSSGNNMIFDHISVEFGQWDSIDAVNTSTFTVQNSIIADPINQQFGAHVEGANATWIGNIWANAHDRQPLAKANTVYVNNVIYNFVCGYTTGNTTGAAYNHDLIDNYFIAGPSTTAPTGDFFQINGGKAQNLYYTGNLLDSAKNGLLGGNPTTPTPDFGGSTGNTLTAPWSPVTPTIPTSSATAAYRTAISAAGALPRDPLDTQVIGQVTSLGSAGAILTSPGSTGLADNGFGTIAGGTPATETDGDGIPDYWKAAVGLNLYTNQAMTIAANGYANIENYINWLAAPNAVTVENTSVTVDLSQYSGGFTSASPVYTVNTANNGVVILNSGHLAQFTPAKNFYGLGSFNFSVLASDGSILTNTVTVCVTPGSLPNPLPSPWATADIGSVGVTGNAAYASGLFTVAGSGADIWGTADAFRYVYQPASGDCNIEAEVLSVQNTAPWAKAGVMIRETTNANATYSMVFLAPVTTTSTNGVAWQERASTGGSSTSTTYTPGLRAPYWVKLARTGNSFVGYYSANGTAWTAMGTNSITMATNAFIGLPVCSVNNAVLNTATFTNVQATP
jgi:regulation of enolase protein 1 (concanavalin A-like superfamily)